MNEVKFCRDCKHSIPEPGSHWNLLCTHPRVHKNDNWALAAATKEGSSAREQRGLTWAFFPPCGRAGKLWEQK